MLKKTLEPRQQRSRESHSKLMKAAAEVLGQHGVEGATIPRIAQHAGLTPGAVYRRFHNKEALLEAVILRILERQDERLRAGMPPETTKQIPLPVLADQIIGSMVLSYRVNASLLRAIHQFSQARFHQPFWKKAARMEIRTFEYLVNLFLVHRRRIRHPNPRAAISLALLIVSSTLFNLVVQLTDVKIWKGLLPGDQVLRRELLRAFLAYLGVEEK